MLPFPQRIAFLLLVLVTGVLGGRGFLRLYRRIAAGQLDTDRRFNHPLRRVWDAAVTTLTQSRTFRKRPWISFFHSFIFYGFVFYLLVNLLDAIDGFVPLSFRSLGAFGEFYTLCADVLSALVLFGTVALLCRRFLVPSRCDFTFNPRTMLHRDVETRYITRDSLIVSSFILFHVGSRAIGAGAKIALEGATRYAPFATLVSHLFSPANATAWRIFGYWGALGSVLLFLLYFPYSKHVHIFLAPVKYMVARDVPTGVLSALDLDTAADEPKLGANKIEDLAWPRLLDAYACIQCNRCQDVCPATATGKALSPSALEINKRMELNELARHQPGFEHGESSPWPLLTFALSPEALWACTTCGACVDVCPVGDEPMLDIVDIRRHQVMVAGDFPVPLQTAFRGMERTQNPWGINPAKRMHWAAGLQVPTTEDNPQPDVLFWVGCAASYDPESQKTARAFVQLLDHAKVDFAVLGKRECCTGDSARRAGNEFLYRQLADGNVATLNEIRPKLIVATCPHCMNSLGKEYPQIGGDYKVMHHTEYLAGLIAEGRLVAEPTAATVAFHDPCYLGRHNAVYDAPRNILNVLSHSVVELDRHRENSFCCGAGGAQFWKEEEAGTERISDNRYREAQAVLAGAEEKVLAVGCPFCKSMLNSTPASADKPLAVRDLAELLWEGVRKREGGHVTEGAPEALMPTSALPVSSGELSLVAAIVPERVPSTLEKPVAHSVKSPLPELRDSAGPGSAAESATPLAAQAPARKKWKGTAAALPVSSPEATVATTMVSAPARTPPQGTELSADTGPPLPEAATSPVLTPAPERKKWQGKSKAAAGAVPEPVTPPQSIPPPVDASPAPTAVRKAWVPKRRAPSDDSTERAAPAMANTTEEKRQDP